MRQLFINRYSIVLLAAFILSACGSNKKKLEPMELESFDKEIRIEKLWSAKIGSGPGKYYHQFTVAVDAKFLYAASEKGKVYKLDKFTGKKIWKVDVDEQITSGVASDFKHVYIATINGDLLALDINEGKQAWKTALDSELVSPPAVNDDYLVVQTTNGKVYSINPENGEKRWQFDNQVPALTLRGNSTPQFFANFVAVGLSSGKLAILDAETGELKWQPKVAEASGDTEIERMIDVDSSALVDEAQLFAVSFQGQLVSYELQTGRVYWYEKESSYKDMATGMGNLYVSSSNGAITAYDKRSGDILWVNEDFLRRKLTAPTAISSYLVVGDYEGYLHILSQLDGHIMARKRVSGSGVRSNIVTDGTRFYSLANNGRLKAYQLGDLID